MERISTLIKDRKQVKGSERSDVVKQIFIIYTSLTEKKHRKIANWKRYCSWCKENKYPNTQTSRTLFRRSHNFLKEKGIKEFCIFIAIFDLQQLYYILSVIRDKNNCGEPCSAWMFSLCKTDSGYNKK